MGPRTGAKCRRTKRGEPMQSAVIYARVSSREQEREGYSIPAQRKLLREYAVRNSFELIREFVDVETAKTTGRKEFGEMVEFLKKHKDCRTFIVEKTDRLYSNSHECVKLEDLNVEIHLPKEGQVISKDSKSQTKLVHAIQLVLARNYVENLREEVKKGMREKAAQGVYPARPPLGYRHNKLQQQIEFDPIKSGIAKRIFELYATGNYSLAELRKTIRTETGVTLCKGYLHKMLRNEFYCGYFVWAGERHKGTHPALINHALFQHVQAVFAGHNKPKYRKHEFAFAGLLTCAYDNCMVTAGMQKQKYTYYHCTD